MAKSIYLLSVTPFSFGMLTTPGLPTGLRLGFVGLHADHHGLGEVAGAKRRAGTNGGGGQRGDNGGERLFSWRINKHSFVGCITVV